MKDIDPDLTVNYGSSQLVKDLKDLLHDISVSTFNETLEKVDFILTLSKNTSTAKNGHFIQHDHQELKIQFIYQISSGQLRNIENYPNNLHSPPNLIIIVNMLRNFLQSKLRFSFYSTYELFLNLHEQVNKPQNFSSFSSYSLYYT